MDGVAQDTAVQRARPGPVKQRPIDRLLGNGTPFGQGALPQAPGKPLRQGQVALAQPAHINSRYAAPTGCMGGMAAYASREASIAWTRDSWSQVVKL
jgi:hypothetical protein